MDAVIYNVSDLKDEIDRLKASKKVQEEAIASHFKSPGAIFHTITSAFKSSPSANTSGGILGGGQDIVSLLSRFVLPLVLNKTLFRSSNFIIKTIVGLLSQQASGFINEKSIGTLWDKVKSIIPNITPKKKPKKATVDYGIPPYSETY
jgi:hypothetical protein